jgi:hypothetical protein
VPRYRRWRSCGIRAYSWCRLRLPGVFPELLRKQASGRRGLAQAQIRRRESEQVVRIHRDGEINVADWFIDLFGHRWIPWIPWWTGI